MFAGLGFAPFNTSQMILPDSHLDYVFIMKLRYAVAL